MLEIHPHDADVRGIGDGDSVTLAGRVGATSLRAVLSDRLPVGVVHTTFHHPVTGANVVTTENAHHIERFWAPGTRADLGHHVTTAPKSLDPVTLAAVTPLGNGFA